MKIKTKLTLLFTLIIALLLIVLNLYIFSLSKSYASNDFFYRLRERTYATANFFLEEDEVSKQAFQKFQEKFLEKIPGEIIRVYDSLNQPAFIKDSIPSAFPKTVIEKTRKEKTFRTKVNGAYLYGIFYNDNQGDFVILVSAFDKSGDAKINHLGNGLLIGFLFSIFISFFIGGLFTEKMLNPIQEIIKHVNTITDTNLHLRLSEVNGKDELAELAITFNRMLARIENAFELQKNFVASASHELRTPLTSIIGNIEVLLSRQRTSDEYKMGLKTILEEAERLHRLSDGLLNIAQASFDINDIKMDYLRLDELLEEAKNIVRNQMPDSKMELCFENMPANSDDLLIKGNKNLLMIAFENLFENANKFSENKKVKIKLVYSPESINVSVSDSGIGIPEKHLGNVLQTFFRAENARRFSGSGVGLALSQKIILLHNGKLSIQSEEGKSTIISVILNKVKIG
jgi:signal transduction histidine kinase